MKKNIFFILSILSLTIHAQNVGINTTEPKRNLDINGNLKVSVMSDKSNLEEYSELLVAEKDNGNIDKIKIPALDQSETKNVEVVRNIYLGTSANNEKECSCGEITFKIDNTNTAKIKLNSTTPLTSIGATSFTFGFGVKQWANQAYSYYDRKGATALNFSTSNYSTYQSLDVNNAFNNSNVIKIFTLILPAQNDLYRLTISRLKNTENIDIFTLICEKFYTQTIQ